MPRDDRVFGIGVLRRRPKCSAFLAADGKRACSAFLAADGKRATPFVFDGDDFDVGTRAVRAVERPVHNSMNPPIEWRHRSWPATAQSQRLDSKARSLGLPVARQSSPS